MKTRLLLAFLAGTLTFAVLRAEELAINTIKFSDPAKPGTLKIRIGRGDLRVTGADVPEITVKAKAQPADSKPRKDGLRVLGAAASYSLTEADNVVTLDGVSGSWGGAHSDFTVTVPRNTMVSLGNSWGGDVTCSDLTGDVEIRSLNGEIHLDRLGGSALVETTNGEIRADLPTLQPGKNYSFTSTNGEIRVRVPAETKANVRLRTQNGSILTDFDEKALLTKLEMIPRKNLRVRTAGKTRSENAPAASETEVSGEAREAMQDALQAGAEVAREALIVAHEAMKKATIELKARNGGGYDNDAPLAPLPPLPPMTGGKIISGTLNGGGPEIQIATMNGDVTLRKLEEKK